MKKLFSILSVFLIFTSCFSQTKYRNPEVDPVQIQDKFEDWSAYQSKKIMLSRDFIALDSQSKEITKEAFLDELTKGNFIPIRLLSDDGNYYYKLFKILPNSDTSIKATIAQEAFDAYHNFKMEGTAFPKFSFKDLNGNLVSNETMKGKIIVIKCWYIHCAACIKEFPKVNALVSKYKDRKDILFVSLAEDTPEQLKVFLAKRPLSYSVIPNMKVYMNETLQLNAFPTHFILNKEGVIKKVVSNYESLEVALAKVSLN
ncbi:TlpA disulfide reductase family protein [Flavobacterium sp. MC2016-06]|uniref:TlpA family protein disulfide reductase n=1 Tax=Flavobacterium sp. MC2016-06 TaxID=2676308 RepID=UPI0012BA9CC7|nr:TlpA disulfide reductase family protein [Flavobacterium sp. MC2016-06]MBU3860848.1 TlpA family protein disulfide reductase [Flavobacterium sp. MC2016-06]